ncbi:MAG: septation protein [Rickettsiaceae bacterium]|jgi:intracellular septation protein|nr:septation protein [Rickettsiaceae bacterium]
MKQPLKSITEFGPLIAFFLAFKFFGIIYATGVLLVTTFIAIVITYYSEKKIPMMPLFSAIVVGVFGGLTIFTHNEIFIKIKPTLINLLFAAILIVGSLRGKALLKKLMDGALHMSDEAWHKLSMRWGLFFLALAVANELVWRNFPTDIWVQFKVFGLLSATVVFMVTQMPFIKRNMIEEKKDE